MKHTLGDAPIDEEYREKMNDLARFLDHEFNGDQGPKMVGFVMMVFPFEGHEGRCNYISNAKRDDIVVLLKEQIKRFEGQPEMKGRA
jgi:hypothetical protein